MIYIIFGHPRDGKTYYATEWAVGTLLKGKRKVITNYPVMFTVKRFLKKPKLFSSLKWEPDYVYKGVTDALVIMDEAYREVSSRDWAKFDKDKHTWFATNGHNNLDIVVIAQDPARVDTVIREMCNLFIWVRKYEIPLLGIPLFFVVETYTSEEQLQKRFSKTEEAIYSKEFLRFKRRIARAYDTHYFRTGKDSPDFVKWSEYLGIEIPWGKLEKELKQ